MSERPRSLWQSSAVLMAAGLAGSAGNYVFQAMMGRLLPLSEFGYFNAAVGLAGMLTVAITAASQAVTHHLARHNALNELDRVEELKAASSRFLLYLTLICSVIAVIFIHPISVFFHVPRAAITGWVLATILVGLWSGLAMAWCAGLGHFHLMAVLGMAAVAVRLVAGALAGWTWNVAESAISASVFSGLSLVVLVAWRERNSLRVRGRLKVLWKPEFVRFFVASLAVCTGNFAFMQSDAVVAQRCLSGPDLGAYTAAGLFGRAVVWLPIPILTVFFTARSGQERSDKTTWSKLAAYVGLLFVGAAFVIVSKGLLCRLLLNRADPAVVGLMNRFALAMIPVGVLQAAGFYVLAARRLAPSLVYGGCGLLYVVALTWWGRNANSLLNVILGGASTAILLMALAMLAKRRRG